MAGDSSSTTNCSAYSLLFEEGASDDVPPSVSAPLSTPTVAEFPSSVITSIPEDSDVPSTLPAATCCSWLGRAAQSVASAVHHHASNAVPHATRSIAMGLQSMPSFDPRGGSFLAYKRQVESKFQKSMEEMRPNFGWLLLSRGRATLRATTQHYRAHKWGQKMKRHFKSRYPGANVPHTNETVSADWVSMKVPGEADGLHGHGGARGFYLFYGGTSKHIAVFPGLGPGCFSKCLKEYIR